MRLEAKLKKLKNILAGLRSVLVAYSGGVDSSLLLKVAGDVLGGDVLAVTALSETYPAGELVGAKSFARDIGVRHKVIKTRELQNPRFRSNPRNRCYYCKKELFSRLKLLAARYRLKAVTDGSNADDMKDERPGAQAKKESGVISPLQEAGLTKSDIRRLSRRMGLSTWRKPALACLASRIPYHSRIKASRLRKIEKSEEILRGVFHIKGNLRVRDFGLTARIEVDAPEIRRLVRSRRVVKTLLGSLGYREVVVDPLGYRMGSLNVQ